MRILASIALAALLMTAACREAGEPAGVRIDPGLLKLVPADTVVLAGASLDSLRQTPTYRKYFAIRPMPGLDDFASRTGVDLRKDISALLYCSNGNNAGVVLARGRFTPAEVEKYKSYRDARVAVAFPDASTVVIGPSGGVKAATDARDRGNGGIPPALRPLVDTVPKSAQVWAVFKGAAIRLPVAPESNLANINRMVQSLQSGVFSADLESGLHVEARGACTSEAAARQIHDALKGIIGFGRLSTPTDRPDLLKVYDSIAVNQNANKIEVSASIPQDLADHFLGMLK
jgi:hypothetical protein